MDKLLILESRDINNLFLQEWEILQNEYILYNNRTYLIGRNVESNIMINDSTISRIHAELTVKDDNKIYLKDLNSCMK